MNKHLQRLLLIIFILSLVGCKPSSLQTPKDQAKLTITGELSSSQQTAAKQISDNVYGRIELYASDGIVNSLLSNPIETNGQNPVERISQFFEENQDLYRISNFSE